MIPALIIVFREGFEAFLSVAIILAYLRKTNRESLRPVVFWGVGVAVVLSAALGYALINLNQPLWEAVFGVIAIVLVWTFVIQMWRTGSGIKGRTEANVDRLSSGRSNLLAIAGVFIFTVLMVAREGMETALMLFQVRSPGFILGAGVGLLFAGLLSWAWAHYGHRINLKRFFQVTGAFMLLFSLQIAVYSLHEFSETGWLPNSEAIHIATEPYSSVGLYGKWFSVLLVVLCGTWLAIVSIADRRRIQRTVSA